MQRFQAKIEQDGWGFWALETEGQFIGFVGLQQANTLLPFSPCIEIGWRLDKAFWGKGLASEAAKMSLAYGFRHLQLSEIVSFTATLNKRSEAVMQRIGMQKQSAHFYHPALDPNSELSEHVLYRISRQQFADACQHGKIQL
jgi:RimJ/RimL family protein N-acetyltransferase